VQLRHPPPPARHRHRLLPPATATVPSSSVGSLALR
jgi:hypothetical protein